MNGQHQTSGSGSTNIQIGTLTTKNTTYNNCVFVKEIQEEGGLNQPSCLDFADNSKLIEHKSFCRQVGIRKEYTVKFVCIRAKVEDISAPMRRKTREPSNEIVSTKIDIRLRATSGQTFKISLFNALPPCAINKYVTIFFVYNSLGKEISYMIFDDYGDELYITSISAEKIFLYLTFKEQAWFLVALLALIVIGASAVYFHALYIPYFYKISTIGVEIVVMVGLFLIVNTIIKFRSQQIKDSIKEIYKSFPDLSAPNRT